jgi:FKBP-type peptidyl-prolyl cis-trans isomerase SlpA
MDRDQFDDEIELVEGLMLSFADAQNAEMPGVVSCFDDDSVTIDFNHPLAGRNIVFEVEILQVAPVVTH